MPIYEYNCGDCESDFELLVRGSDMPTCPACGGQHLEKQLSVPAAHSAGQNPLSMCETPSAETCGLPQCQMGGCQMES